MNETSAEVVPSRGARGESQRKQCLATEHAHSKESAACTALTWYFTGRSRTEGARSGVSGEVALEVGAARVRDEAGSVGSVHPIERLRYVARAGWAAPDVLAAEAAWALADLALRERPAVLPACRRLLDRHPGCGPMWWVAARILTSGDPVDEAEYCADALEGDETDELLDEAVPDGARVVRRGGVGDVASADLVIVQADAFGAGGMIVDADVLGLLEAARVVEVPVWVEAGVGRVLPARLWEALARKVESSTERHLGVLIDSTGVERVVGPNGAQPLRIALAATDCPEPPELLARW
jgi:hypothetical protein